MKQETLEEITEQIQKDCHKFVESIISKVTYQDATNTFLFMKLAELTLKLKSMNDKETLEEAAQKFRSNNPGTMQGGNNTKILNAFKNGAKGQAERMYSEEEVVNILIKAYEDIGKRKIPNQVVLASWFKQFKKK